jgi:hypothetical protein
MRNVKMITAVLTTVLTVFLTGAVIGQTVNAIHSISALRIPEKWEYTAPLITPEKGGVDNIVAYKDPSVVFYNGRWHLFMTIRMSDRTSTAYCSFDKWEDADKAPRTILKISNSKYYCAPQVFWFAPQKKWYLVYQMGVPGSKKMWVAYSTTETIDDPMSWTQARPILDGGDGDPRIEGGIDFWIICDDQKAYLFFTNDNGKLWRTSTRLQDFPNGFNHCEIALQAAFFEASHTYKLKGRDKYLTIIEEDGRRYYKAYLADRLDGPWSPLADTEQKPFAGWANIRPARGVESWTDNVSHGELIRDGNDQTMTIDPGKLRFVFQGMLEKEKSGIGYGKYPWRIGILTPAETTAP